MKRKIPWFVFIVLMRGITCYLSTNSSFGKDWRRFAQISWHSAAVESSWNMMAHGDTRKGTWRGNWRMEWVASTLYTTSEHGVSSISTADAHTSDASSRRNWRPCRLFSARVPSHFKRSLLDSEFLLFMLITWGKAAEVALAAVRASGKFQCSWHCYRGWLFKVMLQRQVGVACLIRKYICRRSEV
jgi:hypothetical protein